MVKKKAKVIRLSEAVGPQAKTIIHENGAKESATPFAMQFIPPVAILETSRVMGEGTRKYGHRNWAGISVEDHINHALVHLYAHLSGDRSEGDVGHLTHATCRVLFALEVAALAALEKK